MIENLRRRHKNAGFNQQSEINNLNRPASLLLALGAIVTAAARDHNALDGRLADQAGLTFAAVDAVL